MLTFKEILIKGANELIKGGIQEIEKEFWTVRLVVGKGVLTDVTEYFFTKEEANKCADKNFSNYVTIVQKEKLKVKMQVLAVL